MGGSAYSEDVLARAAKIRLVIFDVDGVLTDGRLYFYPDGEEFKGFHARDSLGMKLLRSTGVETAIISGRTSPALAERKDSIGINHAYQGCQNKLGAFAELQALLSVTPEQIAHVGDDLLDLPLLRRVGLAIAVADSHPAIHPHAHWMTSKVGGSGAAREVCDLIMTAQGTFQQVIERHF